MYFNLFLLMVPISRALLPPPPSQGHQSNLPAIRAHLPPPTSKGPHYNLPVLRAHLDSPSSHNPHPNPPVLRAQPPPPPSHTHQPNHTALKSESQQSSPCRGGILAYPTDWPNSHYYQRLCYSSSRGLPVITGGLASTAAMERTAWTLDMMMQTMEPYVASALLEAGFRQAVMGSYPSETVTSLPEYSDLDPDFWDSRRGCGATQATPLGSNAEEDVLCYPDDLYRNMDITVHEFGHSLRHLGFNRLWPEFQTDLDACYDNAFTNSLWGRGYVGSYSMTNSDEYFANGLMTYFDVQYPYDEAAPATREELYQMDPSFAAFLDRWMYSNPWRGGCPAGE